jgi:serine/threonine-protein phosphatase 6 regulatory ankyrin repeat subunit B
MTKTQTNQDFQILEANEELSIEETFFRCKTDTQLKNFIEKYPNFDINYKNKHNTTPLLKSAYGGATRKLDILLKHPNIDVNIQILSHKLSALIVASMKNRVDFVKLLLEYRNTDVNIQDVLGNTALHYATHKKIAQLLLQHQKIDVSIKNNDGETAYEYAKKHNHQDLIYQIEKFINSQKI